MVEQFEDRVEDRLDEMEAKLMAADRTVQASEVQDSEQVSKVSKQVPPMPSLLSDGLANIASL